MVTSPTYRPIQLADGQTDPPILVSAVVIRDLPAPCLEKIEKVWMPAREQAARIFHQAGEGGEHGHWDWRNKVWSAESGRHRLMSVECRDDAQGLMAVLSSPRSAVIKTARSPVLYVDFLETAPWNLKGLPTRPRFLGVGTILIAEAVKL